MNQADYRKVREHMLDRIWNVMGEPRHANDIEALIEEYVHALAPFHEDDLRRGCDTVFRTLKVKSWPTIKECLDACRDARSVRQAESRAAAGRTIEDEKAAKTAERERWIASHLKGPLGKAAARQGWILGLQDFVRQHGCLPTGPQQETIKAAARFRAHAASGAIDLGIFHEGLRRIALEMDRKNAELAEQFR